MDITILGIDPGMVRFGWGSVTLGLNTVELGLSGMIAHPRDTDAPFNQYLDEGIAQITDQFPVILSIVQPTFIVAETVPTGRLGSRSELVVAAITSAKVIAHQWGLPWHNMGANTVKKQITDDGNATKARIRNAVIELFPVLGEKHKAAKVEQKARGEKVDGIPQDVFDSIAVAMAGAKIHGESYRGKAQDSEGSL
jgi:Holliday junction resolvasome RuvABC endonuclease subunit